MKIGPIRIATAHTLSMGLAVVLCSVAGIAAQEPAAPRPPIGRPVVDPAAHDRGRALWATHCVQCHGPQARGSDTGPNIIRTKTANYDRSAAQAGSVLGPFLRAGHPTKSGTGASFTDAEIVDLANFLRQRVNDTMRGSPVFTVGDIVTGNAGRGEAFFNGAGGCATCHTGSERSLAGIATRIPAPVDLQQRMLFPNTGGRGRAGRAAARQRPQAHQRRRQPRIAMPSPCRLPRAAARRSRVSSSRRATST